MSTGIEYSVKASGGIGNAKRFGKESTESQDLKKCVDKKCLDKAILQALGLSPDSSAIVMDHIEELNVEIKKLEKKNFGLVTALLGTFIRGPSDYFFCPRCGNAAGKHSPQCPVGDALDNSK